MIVLLLSAFAVCSASVAYATKTVVGKYQLDPSTMRPLNLTGTFTNSHAIFQAVQINGDFGNGTLADPDTPEGYDFVGLFQGANNAPGFMGFTFLQTYDVQACSQLCNSRNDDPAGGSCQYFNIWQAVVNGTPSSITCSFYYLPTDASTAKNTGQGNLVVTQSRGFKRHSVLPDGGFEDTPCPGQDFCFLESTPTWIGTSPPGGFEDALFFFFKPYAHSGNGVVTLGSGTGLDPLSGTITPRLPLSTIPGRSYQLQFFHNSNFNTGFDEEFSTLTVMWNDDTVFQLNLGATPWLFFRTVVTARGNDILQFTGGSYPSYDLLDDINVFLL